MIVIGLVGKIAAGKSTVAKHFAARGASCIDADAIAHEVLAEPDVRAAIVDRFGPDVLDAKGLVHRPALAERVFGPTAAHAEDLAALEGIVHPRVHRRISQALDAFRAAEPADSLEKKVVVLDVPLLLRAGWADACDRIVHVTCDEGARRARLAARGISREQQAAREASWQGPTDGGLTGLPAGIPPQKTVTVDTSEGLEYTRRQVDRIWQDVSRR
jgi:dephospho-CoA kinase